MFMTKRFIISINSLWKCHVRPVTGNTVHTWQHNSPITLLLTLAFHFCMSFKDGTEVVNYLETPADQCIILCFLRSWAERGLRSKDSTCICPLQAKQNFTRVNHLK